MTGSIQKSPLVDHKTNFAPTMPTGENYLVPTAPDTMTVMTNTVTAPSDLSRKVAGTLEIVSRRIDNKLLEAKYADSQARVLNKRTIWDIAYEDFRSIMHGVFTSLDESVLDRSSGWEMTALVYRGVAGLVRDLRQQSGDQNNDHGIVAREGTLQRYVGDFLEEIGLMTWINGEGGLVSN